MTTLGDFSATTLTGEEKDLSDYQGEVVVVVNTASKCGLTPQYEGLEELYQTYKDRGLVVLGFPSNQFGNQEPGEESEIAEFCQLNYGVTFPMFAKVDVNGSAAHPLWKWLRSEKGTILGHSIKWNFTKFLVGKDGHVVKRFSPTDEPKELAPSIEKLLATG